MARHGAPPPRKVVRKTAPVGPGGPVRSPGGRRPVPPKPSLSGRVVAVLLGGLFVVLVLLAAVKGFGALGHPLLGLLIGLACLASSALIYFLQARKSRTPSA